MQPEPKLPFEKKQNEFSGFFSQKSAPVFSSLIINVTRKIPYITFVRLLYKNVRCSRQKTELQFVQFVYTPEKCEFF